MIRQQLEQREKSILHPRATLSSESLGRVRPIEECSYRTVFQRDRDRILHSKAFRRLKHKTQVFMAPSNDHYRTRLTHTLEVSQIARTITRALGLNEDLTEAIALGHDLGHTPMGHAGERVLADIMEEGFHHAHQSLRVVDLLENHGAGLNLTREVRDGILLHSKGKGKLRQAHLPMTLEGQVVRISDAVAYINHDIDDALRAELLHEDDLPRQTLMVLGRTHSQRIQRMVEDIIFTTMQSDYAAILMSDEVNEATEELKTFMYNAVYPHPSIQVEFEKAYKIIKELYEYYQNHINSIEYSVTDASPQRQVCDYLAGMTDRYLLDQYHKIFLPKPWGM
ncbi:deoxyguanosinetriphosphate triphosphohydrolase [Desulfurispirillum indicum S5]|uniref:Deoxyguanosinetriphosphate triphosphohydrolase-like protein n=1 Tax=Desulfurispirillum indicum (strain ATCC BAA-1389 / DSM 22839 / S5) TaxID=653733 RepID=E6W597_DESIS|nr:deoxyguanosinetriphosphate triphosphohydrolase [Desulfurispirillum indicum]ADU67176.1 deoxyguanosinetriphosphate triphosphohydrolase [Desulfurispirillum indicum S5]